MFETEHLHSLNTLHSTNNENFHEVMSNTKESGKAKLYSNGGREDSKDIFISHEHAEFHRSTNEMNANFKTGCAHENETNLIRVSASAAVANLSSVANPSTVANPSPVAIPRLDTSFKVATPSPVANFLVAKTTNIGAKNRQVLT